VAASKLAIVDRISARALNRATLARQMLLERVDATALATIEHLGGVQAQAPYPPYFGLWSRLATFRPAELAGLIERREVVRLAAMRSTVHLLSAADALDFRALVQPALERGLRSTPFGKQLASTGTDVEQLVEAGRVLLNSAPRTGAQIAAELGPRWPALTALTIQNTLRSHLALVQVPPRGVWGRGGQPTLTTVEAWLGRPLSKDASIERMVLRHLGAFGPASTADVQAWSGLTRLGEVVDRLKDKLIAFTGPAGTTLYDLPDAPRPDADTPAPARLLAEFDNLTLSYADRTRVLADDVRRRAYTANGIIPGMILLDGVVVGTWKLRPKALALKAFRKITAGERSALLAEAVSVLAFAAPKVTPEIIWVE
jgi:Winged helix DNA-binding domain